MARDDPIEVEPDEELLAVARASFRGAAAASSKATFALGSNRMRMRAFDAWHDAAVELGFPRVPPDMVVAATPRRVLFGKPTFWGRPPSRYWAGLDLAQISHLAAVRHGIVTAVVFVLENGAIVEIEAVRGRRLRHFVEVVEEHRPRR